MNIDNPAEPLLPPSPSAPDAAPVDRGTESPAGEIAEAPEGEFSSVGLLCDGILSEIDSVAGFPDAAKMIVGTQLANILAIAREHEERERLAKRRISALKGDVRARKEQLAVLHQEHFDKSSEKTAAIDGDEDFDLTFDDDEDEVEEQAEKPKGKRPQKRPKGTEMKEVHHFPADRTCCSCCGHEMPSFSFWASVQTRIIPEHVEHIRHIYHICACNHDERCKENKPVAAKSQNYIMRGRRCDAASIVEAAVQKFGEHIPIYRMAERFRAVNENPSRQAIGNSVSYLALRHLDQVRGHLGNHVIWALCRDERNWNPEAQPAVVYEFAPSRAGSVIEEILRDASLQFLITDGYAGYNRVFAKDGANDGLLSVRCWAHARRAFFEAELATKSPLAQKIVQMVRKMYAVEKAAKGLPPEARLALRQEKTLPILAAIRADLVKAEPEAEGTVKKAIDYTLKAFEALQRFAFDGRLEIDNNPVERCIRGIALTKKNSLFIGRQNVAQVWAIYYSLIESARLNRINPRAYLNWVVGEIKRNQGDVDHAMLMPWHCPVGKIED
ncbi:IS66 family transposase [Sinirhodobacter populi]|uniref:IS66 family transposase n=1 Tax=Paenirhodobacter populi TaxID=2306993 RepID=A0A443KGL5_9RHOB|nr:IS66 family transposase [Sinirhodobacter populi]RWR31911.1 IS66 family transposase [Sinirhodobacter populi]